MIWVLLEITLPLCLAFLFGLGAGWLFWRWRRRSINQAEWDSHGKMSVTDSLKFNALQEEAGVYQRRAEQLDASAQQHFLELGEAESHTKALSADLKAANEKIEALGHQVEFNKQDNSINFDAVPAAALPSNVEEFRQQKNKIQELEFRSNNLQNTVDQQSNELQQSKREIKKLTTDLKTANDHLAPRQPNAEDLQKLETKLAEATSEKDQAEQQLKQNEKQLKEAASEVNLQRNTAMELKAHSDNLETTIEKHADEVLEEKKKVHQFAEEIEILRTQLANQNDSGNEELQALKSKLESATTKASEAEQKLAAGSSEAEQRQARVTELELTIQKLESNANEQSADLTTKLQDSNTKQAHTADDLKAALENLEKLEQQSSTSTEDQEKLQSELAVATSDKNLLTLKLQDASSRATHQTRLANELQQKLKQSETVATERDTAIEKIKQLEERHQAATLQNTKLEQTRTQLDTVNQKFRNFQASSVANRQAREEHINQLKAQNERLNGLIDQEREKASGDAVNQQKLRQLESQLEAQVAQAKVAAAELNQAQSTITNLNKQLDETKVELAKKDNPETDEDQSQTNQLSKQNAKLHRQLQQAQADNKELSDTRLKLTEATSQLYNANARNKQLAASIECTPTSSAVTPISVGQIKKLKATIEEKEKRIEELEKKLKPKIKKPKSTTKTNKNAWQKGETKVGTPGSDHKDDLTTINGIGPKIEKVLNRLGIKSWEQLAALNAADIKHVDEALVDFSGRIKRDEWVPQAKAIMKNGHQPLDKKPAKANRKSAKPAKRKTNKKTWQQGKTRLGTPGSAHRDDLKVINGIGPVIEKTLNRYGIKSWEQLASLKVKDIKTIDEALDLPGRINREQWVPQAKALVKQFPDQKNRPTRRTHLNPVTAAR